MYSVCIPFECLEPCLNGINGKTKLVSLPLTAQWTSQIRSKPSPAPFRLNFKVFYLKDILLRKLRNMSLCDNKDAHDSLFEYGDIMFIKNAMKRKLCIIYSQVFNNFFYMLSWTGEYLYYSVHLSKSKTLAIISPS